MNSRNPPQGLPQLIATNQVIPTMQRIVADLRAVRDEVVTQVRPEAACFENVARPLIDVENRTDGEMSVIAMLRYASPDPDARAASDEACKLWAECGAELTAKADLFELFKRVRVDPGDHEAAKYVDSVLTDFARAGHGKLSQADIDRHVNLVSNIDDMRREFNRNVRDDTQFLRFSLEELEGVPQQHLERFRENAEDDPGGPLHVQLRQGDMTPVLEYAEDPRTREKVYMANMTRRQRNVELFRDIISHRCEHAKLLGYDSHAAFRLEKRVAKSPDWVFRLFDTLEEACSERGKGEMDVLRKMRAEDWSRSPGRFSSQPADDFPPWDYHYYARLLAAENSVDQLTVSGYFPLQHVIMVMLELFAACLQLEFVAMASDQTQGSRWHDDVEVWSVWDKREGTGNGEFVGYLFMDLLSRPNKYQGSQNVTLQAVSASLQSRPLPQWKLIRLVPKYRGTRTRTGRGSILLLF